MSAGRVGCVHLGCVRTMRNDGSMTKPSSGRSGHLFVVRGRIGEIVADAVVVSTDRPFNVVSHWNTALGLSPTATDGEIRAFKPAEWLEDGWGRSAVDTPVPVWFLDVWDSRQRPGPVLQRLARLLEAAADATDAEVMRHRPLILLPVIGTNLGGFGENRGEMIAGLLERCSSFVETHLVDVAIVVADRAAFGALQNHRRSNPERYFSACIDPVAAERLGSEARSGSLALFVGAGASLPAGLPSWKDLISKLAERAGLESAPGTDFDRLNPLDQAELLQIRLSGGLSAAIKQIIGSPSSVALSHVLLAGLECQNAVTTNYDDLYERAVRQIDRRVVVVLPDQVPNGSDRWLLKMHGTLDNEESIVLTRSHFVGYDAASAPSGAVLQALLLTKHLLIVGTSMTDDNVLRLIHEVAAFRQQHEKSSAAETTDDLEQSPRHRFGTIVDVSANSARQILHEQRFHWLSMRGASIEERGRALEIFLDVVSAYASTDSSWLLDPRFDALLEPDQKEWAAAIRQAAGQMPADDDAPGAWRHLRSTLSSFGAP